VRTGERSRGVSKSRRTATVAEPHARVPNGPMRAMFVVYIVLIAAGLVTFTAIGLTHH
jgi:hypothetical protein